ncbi:hypothetical protein IAT40_004756 [Kwoniella sp. CBS 6097]
MPTFLQDVGQPDDNPDGDHQCRFKLGKAYVTYSRKEGTESIALTLNTDVTESQTPSEYNQFKSRRKTRLTDATSCPVSTSGRTDLFTEALNEALDDGDATCFFTSAIPAVCRFDRTFEGLPSVATEALANSWDVKGVTWKEADRRKWKWT